MQWKQEQFQILSPAVVALPMFRKQHQRLFFAFILSSARMYEQSEDLS